ncbi:MAG: DUF3575 domain-containing protein [Alistipes sp.]|nr:DUF3575 domain-containing protein [Alistipes sp.]
MEKSVKICFRQGAVVLDEDYKDNRAVLTDFANEVKNYYNDSTAQFRQIRILSSTSPEGGAAINDRIAKRRAAAISEWIGREINAKVGYEVVSMGLDWDELIDLVQGSEEVPYRDEVVALLQNTEESARHDALMKLRGGVPYYWLYKNFFDDLRYAAAYCEFWWETIPELRISSDVQRFAADGATAAAVPYTKTVADDVMPVAESSADWITPLPSTNDEVRFDVAPSRSTEPREATVAVKYHDKVYNIPVEQDGVDPVLTITSSNTVNYPAEGATDVVTFEKNVDDEVAPVVRCSADWIESIESTPEGITCTVAENTSTEPRTTTIVVESYGSEHEVVVNQVGATPKCKPFYMAVKTNMLYDIMAVPNIGAEFYLGKNFSIAANYAHAWWGKEEKNFYWRYYGADASVRWWFGKASRVKPLQGHHVGVNYQILTYDFQLGKNGILAGMPGGNLVDRANHIVALEYGYSVPISKRLNIDFAVGAGYHWGLFDEYTMIDGHAVWQATKRRQYFGPTKLEISLVWLIGCDNINKEKKGKK